MRPVLFAVSLLALVWGLRFGSRPLTAFGLASLTVLVVLRLLPRWAARGLRLERVMSDVVCEEDAIPVTFTLHNTTRLPLLTPEIVDRFPPDRIDPRRAFVYPVLPARRAAESSYQGRCHSRRGPYRIGPARVRVSCPLGLFHAEYEEPRGRRLVVFPALEAVTAPDHVSRGRAPSFGGAGRREAGEGDLILGVREYRAGDALSRIHWPTTARRGRLSILEYERQLARRVTIAIDLSRASLRGLGRQANVEVAIRSAAALTAACLKRGDRVALMGEHRELLYVPAGRGDAQLLRVLESLALLKPEGERRLSALVDDLAPELIPGQTLVVVVSDLAADGEALLPALGACVARGCEVIAVLLDPETFPQIFEIEARQPTTLEQMAEACLLRGVLPYAVSAAQPLGEAFLAPWAGRKRVRITREMLA